MPGYHGKKKPAKKKRVKAGYGKMKKVKAGYGKMKRVKAKAKNGKANGLTPAQKKLPAALQKAILKKKKKK
jgi:hypothetical protein